MANMEVIKLDLNKLPTKALYHMALDFSKLNSRSFAKACGLSFTYVNDAVNENKEKASDASIKRVRKISKMYIYQNVDKYFPLPLIKNKED